MISKNKLQTIIDKYGDLQITVAIEELSELTKELCKKQRGKDNVNLILEEIADVFIMLEQLKLLFNISDDDIEHMVNYKIKRTLERMNKNEKDN